MKVSFDDFECYYKCKSYSWTFFTSNERHIGVGESILTKKKRIWIQMNVNEHQKVYLSTFSFMSVENLINVCVIYDRRKSIATSKPILEFKTVKPIRHYAIGLRHSWLSENISYLAKFCFTKYSKIQKIACWTWALTKDLS